MLAWLEDAFFWGVVLVALWLALPGHVRTLMRGGVGPLIHALADIVRRVARAVLPRIEWVAFQVVTGGPPPPHDNPTVNPSRSSTTHILSSSDDEDDDDRPELPQGQHPTRSSLPVIATRCPECNEALPVAQDAEWAAAVALARLIRASQKKPFTTGEIGKARGIEIVWKTTRSGKEHSLYAEAGRVLDEALRFVDDEAAYLEDLERERRLQNVPVRTNGQVTD
jgi:hypothetical protein